MIFKKDGQPVILFNSPLRHANNISNSEVMITMPTLLGRTIDQHIEQKHKKDHETDRNEKFFDDNDLVICDKSF